MCILIQFILALIVFAYSVNLTYSLEKLNKNTELPLVINTWAFTEANNAAWNVLLEEPAGSALDALVEGCTRCEQLQCDGTVGYGGSPDERGETTLDALVMDGSNMNIGAVAALRQIKDAARVARFVLEHTQHTMLAGDAATDFAERMGFKRESLATAKSREMWLKWQEQNCQPNFWLNVYPDANTHCGPYTPLANKEVYNVLETARQKHNFGQYHHDTIGMIVIDKNGHIFAGTSTNGARHKIPGRVGDSPIPGAGAYADNEVGAAVATGDGDVMMRFLPALLAVEAMRAGHAPAIAAQSVMQRILRFYPQFSGGLVVASHNGKFGAACVGMQKFPYSVAQGVTKNATRVEYVKCITKKYEQ